MTGPGMRGARRGTSVLLCLSALLALWPAAVHAVAPVDGEHDYQSFDGFFNNPAHPTWGAIESEVLRQTIPAYADGVFIPPGIDTPDTPRAVSRPNARVLSNTLFSSGVNGAIAHQRNLTVMFTTFGQFLVQEITETVAPSCPPEYFSIPTPADDPEFAGVTIPMVRSVYDRETGQRGNLPRLIRNAVTPYLDYGNLYGQNRAWADVLRTFRDGEMRLDDRGLPPRNEEGLPIQNLPPPRHFLDGIREATEQYLSGNPRSVENPAIWIQHVVWLREHNFQAQRLKQLHPEYNDEQLYHRARQIVIAEYQHVVMDEWLPLLLGRDNPLGDYNAEGGYNENLHPQVFIEFSTLAMRFGHTLIPQGFRTRDPAQVCSQTEPVRLCNAFHNIPEEIERLGFTIEPLLLGIAAQATEAADLEFSDDVRSFLFGSVDVSRRDLIAINIQRGRDHGLADYNQMRESYNLTRVTSFTQLAQGAAATCDADCVALARTLAELYHDNLDDIDAFVGGMLEVNRQTGDMGPLFDVIITEQFRRTRHADRYYFENTVTGFFSNTEIAEIKQLTYSQIIQRNMLTGAAVLTDQVFQQQDGECSFPPMDERRDGVEACVPVMVHDLQGSQLPDLLLFILIVLGSASLVGVAALLAIKVTRRRRKKLQSSLAVQADNTATQLDAERNSAESSGDAVDQIVGRENAAQFMRKYSRVSNKKEKRRMLFQLYDVNHRGRITAKEFEHVLRTNMQVAGVPINASTLRQCVEAMFADAGVSKDGEINFDKFNRILDLQEHRLRRYGASARLTGRFPAAQAGSASDVPAGESLDDAASNGSDEDAWSVQGGSSSGSAGAKPRKPSARDRLAFAMAQRGSAIVVLTLYTLLTVMIFVERAYTYGYESETGGLRKVTGTGVSITRGAASLMAWTLTLIPLTMSRAVLTTLQQTPLSRFIPFEHATTFHKIVGTTFGAAVALHSVGHTFNFWFISGAHPVDITCILPEIVIYSHELPTMLQFWVLQTTTGLSGLILVVICLIMLVFSLPVVREKAFRAFWRTHQLYPLLYFLTFVHGSAQLVQAPLFWHYGTASILVYAIDRFLRHSRSSRPVKVDAVYQHPSQVLEIRMEKPPDFNYLAGQWMYVSCPAVSWEKHPFTITSAPFERHISVHIRVLGPWTLQVWNALSPGQRTPLLHLDGPFGEVHERWDKYRVAVLIGGGIGVTPFASILKHLLYRVQQERLYKQGALKLEKLHFFWICRKTTQLEWFHQLVADLEAHDLHNILSMHQFLTGSLGTEDGLDYASVLKYEDIDFRPVLLSIGEYQHRRITGRGFLNGQRAPTHFGRPDWPRIFQRLVRKHHGEKVGVFVSGSRGLHVEVHKNTKEYSTPGATTFDYHEERGW